MFRLPLNNVANLVHVESERWPRSRYHILSFLNGNRSFIKNILSAINGYHYQNNLSLDSVDLSDQWFRCVSLDRCSLSNTLWYNTKFITSFMFKQCNLMGADFTGVVLPPNGELLFEDCHLFGVKGLPLDRCQFVAQGFTIQPDFVDHTNESQCSACNCNLLNTNVKHYNTKPYCHSCYESLFATCFSCTERTADSCFYDSRGYCAQCFRQIFRHCERCGRLFNRTGNQTCCCVGPESNSDGDSDEDDDDLNETRDGALPIHPYGYQPKPIFFAATKQLFDSKTLFFGTELEVESNKDESEFKEDAERVTGTDGWCYCKSDGSLDNGFEIVSHPFSWEWFKEKGEKTIKPKFDYLINENFKSYRTNTCGLHVHLSRSAFNVIAARSRLEEHNVPVWRTMRSAGYLTTLSPHLYKFCKFYYNNPDFVRFISRRRKDHINQYATPYYEPGRTRGQLDGYPTLAAIAKGQVNEQRYTAVNCQNSNSIEVRVFRGTLSWTGYCRALEFCHATFMFARQAAFGQLDYVKFINFIMERKVDYPNLTKFISDRLPEDLTSDADASQRVTTLITEE